ncbi:Acetyltransferase [Cupriavidus sp. H18C1]|uniref:GNAT family N-acetyltransferase n=1 Tax=Cupriavidus sp. H18C1 TaxID=3241601 RepID=UPI003BB99DF4
MQVERVERIAPEALAAEDFSFDIEYEAVAPFDGPGMPNVVPVEPRTKAYGFDESLSEPVSDSGRLLLAAKDGLHLAGYLVATPVWNGCASIDDFAISRRYRRSGVGRRLMDEAVAWAAALNLKAIRLETQSSNVSACRFYARYGFVLGGYDRYLYSQLDENVRKDVALYWYLFL